MNNRFIYNSRDILCKAPFGAVCNNTLTRITLRAFDGIYIKSARLVITNDFTSVEQRFDLFYSRKEESNISVFNCVFELDKPGLYWYHFEVETEYGLVRVYRNNMGDATLDGDRQYQLTVYDAEYETPNFIKGGIIYHIFVDRFFKKENNIDFNKQGVLKNWNEEVTIIDPDGVFRANDFYGGNFTGIEEKLPYLKSLNVKLIYLSPIFKASSNHRYDTGDYLQLDDLLGSEEEFLSLINKAKAMGIYVMLDGVFNHTGADSLYFNKFNNYPSLGAYQSKDSNYFSWYDFNNFPDEYRCWWGVTISPSVRQTNSEYRSLILDKDGVIDKWNKFGVSGWRLDVVDELIPEFVKDIRKSVKESNKNNLLIGEVWEDASCKTSYSIRREYFLGEELDGVMNYVFKDEIIHFVNHNSINRFTSKVMDIVENYPKKSLDVSMTLLDTHDTWRAINYFSNKEVSCMTKHERLNTFIKDDDLENAKKKLKMAIFLQYTLPGVPSVYYGDEILTQGYEDPINRRTMNWDNIDEELLAYYKRLGQMRKIYKHIFVGDFSILRQDEILVFRRHSARRQCDFYINNSDSIVYIENKNYEKCVFGDVNLKEEKIAVYPKSYLALIKNK